MVAADEDEDEDDDDDHDELGRPHSHSSEVLPLLAVTTTTATIDASSFSHLCREGNNDESCCSSCRSESSSAQEHDHLYHHLVHQHRDSDGSTSTRTSSSCWPTFMSSSPLSGVVLLLVVLAALLVMVGVVVLLVIMLGGAGGVQLSRYIHHHHHHHEQSSMMRTAVLQMLSWRHHGPTTTTTQLPLFWFDDDDNNNNNTQSWNDYRIGDGIKFIYQPNNCSDPSWSWTIVCLYQSRTKEHSNIDILTQVLVERQTIFENAVASASVSALLLLSNTTKEEDANQTRQQQQQQQQQQQELLQLQVLQNYDDRPADDQLVVHLRLGDGLCGNNWTLETGSCTRPRPPEAGPIRDCWNYPVDCYEFMDYAYAYPKSWYSNIASELKSLLLEQRMSRVVIVSNAGHWTRFPDPRHGNYTVDNLYRRNVASFFHELGFHSVDFRNAEEIKDNKTSSTVRLPDHDFVYLCAAKAFVLGGGGFSELVANVVRKQGGTVVEPRRDRKY